MEVTSLPLVVLHWARTAAAVTPTVPSLALTPQRKAVAVPALSATCALVLYVCGVAETVTRSQVLTAITCMGLPNVACMWFACYLGCKLLDLFPLRSTAWWLFLVRIRTTSSKTMYFITSLHISQRLNASKIMCLSRRQVGVSQNWLFLNLLSGMLCYLKNQYKSFKINLWPLTWQPMTVIFLWFSVLISFLEGHYINQYIVPLSMKKKPTVNRVRPWPKTQRGSAPSPAVSPLRSARSADPWVSERLLLLARPSLNTKNRSPSINPRQDIFKIRRMVPPK